MPVLFAASARAYFVNLVELDSFDWKERLLEASMFLVDVCFRRRAGAS